MAARAPKRLSATQWYVRSEPGNSESGSNASSGEQAIVYTFEQAGKWCCKVFRFRLDIQGS